MFSKPATPPQIRRRRLYSLATLALGLIIVAVVAVSLRRAVPLPTDVGSVPGAAVSAPPPPAAASSGSTEATPHVSTVPVRVTLPTLNVTAAVDAVDSVQGVLQVPGDPSVVGWWARSAAPGSAAGTTVLDGHINSAAAGPGALFHLADLDPGDPVTVATATGSAVQYVVRARRVYPKSAGLPAEIFAQDGAARLVLISCGGPFDSVERSYQDNIVVYATPAG